MSKEGIHAFHNLVRQIKLGLCVQLENTKMLRKETGVSGRGPFETGFSDWLGV